MRRLLTLLSVLLLIPGWVYAAETTETATVAVSETQPAPAVHSVKKKGGSTAAKSSKGKKSHR